MQRLDWSTSSFTLTLTVALALGAASTARPDAASAQSPVTTTAEVNLLSDYLFAGIPFASGEVTQAKVTVATAGFTFNAFSVYDYDRSEVTEFDLYGDYYSQLSPGLGLFVGGALYNFDLGTTWESTVELYGGLVLTAPLSPTLYVAHDFDLGDGTHATLMLSESLPLGASGASVTLAGNIDYNDDYYVDFSGFSYLDLGATVSVPVGPVNVSPMITVQFALDEDFEQAAFVDDVEEVFGVSLSWTF